MEISLTVTYFHLCLLLLYASTLFIGVVAMDLCEFEKLERCKSDVNIYTTNKSNEVQTEESTFSTTYASESNTEPLTSTKHTTEETTSHQCGPNMEYTKCTCHGSCQDPDGCINICTHPTMCICSEGYLLNGIDCVTPEKCGCYLEGVGILLEGQFYVNADCTQRVICTFDQLIWDEVYVCSPYATCNTKDNIRQCYCDFGYIGDGLSCSLPSDCLDLYNAGYTTNDVYNISLNRLLFSTPFEVYCDMSGAGGWTVFQRRGDGSVDFYKDWDSYKQGFGTLTGEFWLGNEKLYHLTNQKRYTIKFDLVNQYGDYYYAIYDAFRISGESDNYRLIVIGSYTGTADTQEHSFPAGYAFSFHLNHEFSTFDRDNDWDQGNCAEYNRGAWWYAHCHYSNLNGDYFAVSCSVDDIDWSWLPGSKCNLRSTQMKLRPYV